MKTNPSTSGGHVYADGPHPERPWQLRVGFWLLLAISAFYLLTEHRAHLALGLPYLPFLLLAACPLIHMFGHGGHGGHGGHVGNSKVPPPDAEASTPNEVDPGTTESKNDAAHRH